MPQPHIWITASVLLALLLGLLGWSVRRRRALKRRLPIDWALAPRPVFNADERRFHRQLVSALPGFVIMAKLPLVRLCQPVRPREVRYWYELLGAIHVSFAIATLNGRVVAVLDVDNERNPSRRGQQIKQSVLTACGVRYLRCAPDQLPSVPELQQLVPTIISPSASGSPVSATRERLASTVKSRRQERATLWQDSTNAQADSSFGAMAAMGDNSHGFGGMVVDSSDPPVRH